MATVIDGKAIAAQIRAELKAEVEAIRAQGEAPGLAVVLVGEDPASQVYVRNKQKACEEIGMVSFGHFLPAHTTESELLALVETLNADSQVHGILVQLPLPKHISEKKVVNSISPAKDVDGLHPANVGKLLIGEDTLVSCTPQGCQELLVRSGYDPSGKHVVIVGRSNLVGKPLAAILMQKAKGANATVTICHSGTKDIPLHTLQADILVTAMGNPGFIKADMVREGVVVIDVGTTRVEDATKKTGYRLAGDVEYEGVAAKAAAITPVPGGVGPMTITMLLKNTLKAYRAAQRATEGAG